ncbi:MAG: aldo/keto reductase [Bacteroidota bacterium]
MPIESIQLTTDYSISRIIKGGWHLAGGHGSIDQAEAVADMLAFVESGITTFDCADIYTGVEAMIGQFLRKEKDSFRSGNLPQVQVHTKYVPDYSALSTLTPQQTEAIINRSIQRLGVDQLDLVQFHWWDYQIPGYVETAMNLMDLKRKGKIRNLAVTNFDTGHLQEMLDAGLEIISHQVQYSVLDQRVEDQMLQQAKNHSYYFLCYGVIAGGFLSDRYLGVAEPKAPLENRSLTKYRLIIEEFGSWDFFQECLQLLRKFADQYQVDIAEIAARYILQKEQVGGVIIGARNRKHLEKYKQIFTFSLSTQDLNEIDIFLGKANGPKGPFYALERDKEGRHGRIMKYNLNKD